jgi:hypothetical protein
MTVDRNQLLGLEFDFALIDGDGHVALFSTAGYGPIPKNVLAAAEPSERADPQSVLLASLPEVGAARVEGRGPGTCTEWPALGCRGVFVYDWLAHDGPYERVIAPEVAIVRDDLSVVAAGLIAGAIGGCFDRLANVPGEELGA